MKTLTIVELSDLRKASDGREYFVAGFSAGFGQRIVKRTFWQQFKRDKNGELTNETYWERGSYEEAKALMASKTPIDGEKITRNVESYEIGERVVNTFSTVIFPDENEYTLFNSQNHPIVDEDGVSHGKAVITSSMVSAPEEEVEEEEEEEEVQKTAKPARSGSAARGTTRR